MIIIIEGPDLSGKTYAIEKIAKHFNMGFVLKNSFKPKSLEDTNAIFAQYWNILNIVSNQRFVILDRFFPSQAVYSYLRGEDHFGHSEIRALDNFCAKAGILYIYLDTAWSDLKKRYDTRGDEHVTKDMLSVLKERYDEFYEMSKMDKIRINTLKSNWLKTLEAWINEHK